MIEYIFLKNKRSTIKINATIIKSWKRSACTKRRLLIQSIIAYVFGRFRDFSEQIVAIILIIDPMFLNTLFPFVQKMYSII
jgi:hypothetical protein